jgi:hypothetical protein
MFVSLFYFFTGSEFLDLHAQPFKRDRVCIKKDITEQEQIADRCSTARPNIFFQRAVFRVDQPIFTIAVVAVAQCASLIHSRLLRAQHPQFAGVFLQQVTNQVLIFYM